MEERIIDDEYGRGVRLKKTADGYVDVTDATLDDGEPAEEMAFEFPVIEQEEDDEELVGLSPEEAVALRQRRAEELAARKEKYASLCAEGNAFLEAEDFINAELVFKEAMKLDETPTEASVGYMRARTDNFLCPNELLNGYIDLGVEHLEYDLGAEAIEIVKKEYGAQFEEYYKDLKKQEEPLAEEVEGKQQRRREVLNARFEKRVGAFIATVIPTVAFLVLTIVFGLKNFTTRGNEYILPTIIFGVLLFVMFMVFVVMTNKLINTVRIRRENEKLSATEEGRDLEVLREFIELTEVFMNTEKE